MITLTYTDPDEGMKITVELESEEVTLTEALQTYVNFLRCIGYTVPEEYDTM
jgi:hypothetical protein